MKFECCGFVICPAISGRNNTLKEFFGKGIRKHGIVVVCIGIVFVLALLFFSIETVTWSVCSASNCHKHMKWQLNRRQENSTRQFRCFFRSRFINFIFLSRLSPATLRETSLLPCGMYTALEFGLHSTPLRRAVECLTSYPTPRPFQNQREFCPPFVSSSFTLNSKNICIHTAYHHLFSLPDLISKHSFRLFFFQTKICPG